jgi:hypothetical protein
MNSTFSHQLDTVLGPFGVSGSRDFVIYLDASHLDTHCYIEEV